MKCTLLVTFLLLACLSCDRAPTTIVVGLPDDMAHINALLDGADDATGPRLVCIYIAQSDDVLVYRVNDRVMDQAQFDMVLEKVAAIDPGQTLAIEFGEGTDERDLEATPTIQQFTLVGRNGREHGSIRGIQ